MREIFHVLTGFAAPSACGSGTLRSQRMRLSLLPLTHSPFRSRYRSTSKPPSTKTVRYEAGIDWRKVDDGVMGDRNDSVSVSGRAAPGPSISYVRLVVEASKVAPR